MSRELTEKLLKAFVDTGDMHMSYRELAVISAKEIERLLAQEREKVKEACAKTIEDWRECSCGLDAGEKYNTECGHAIDCDHYLAASLRQLDLTKPESDLAASRTEEKKG